MSKRIESLDIAKAVCIILVVVGHFIPGNAPEWYVKVHDVIYTFHMPLFMFASGFVYIATKKDISYKEFLLKKFRRLMIPYFSTSAIVITIKMLTQGAAYVENPVTAYSYLRMFYLPEAGYFLWFIWALWWMFVILPLFKTTYSRFVLFLLAIALHYIPFTLTGIFCLTQFKSMLVFFMLGVVAYEIPIVYNYLIHRKWSSCVTVIALFIDVETSVICDNVGGGGKSLLLLILPYLGILFILEISKIALSIKILKNLLLTVAGSSYIVYLFHTTFEGFAKAFCYKLPISYDANLTFILMATFVVFSGVIFPIFLHRFILKRFAITRTLFGL